MDFNTGTVCTKAQVETFIQQTTAFFRQTSYVERWAYFGAFPTMASGANGNAGNPNGMMNTDSTPNDIGKLFVSR
jgi:hypothetical protein